MVAKNLFNADLLVETAMDKLFQLFEYVYQKSSFLVEEAVVVKAQSVSATVPAQQHVPTISFSDQDRMVEGELFK